MVEIRGAFPVGSEASIGLSRSRRDRHVCQPARSWNGFDPLSPPIGPPGRDSRNVGLCPGWNGHGLVHPLRHCARRGSPRPDPGSGRPHHSWRGRRALGRRTRERDVRGLERRPADDARLAGRLGRPRLAKARARSSADGMHREAELCPERAAELQSAPRNANAAPPGPGQHTPFQGRLAIRLRGRPGRPAAGTALDRALLSNRARPERRASGRSHDERVCPVRTAHVRERRLGYPPRRSAELAIRSIGRFCDNIPAAIIDVQVLGPPDIEREVGLAGGHIFQGECLPENMWDRRFSPRTPMPGNSSSAAPARTRAEV